MEIGTPGHLTAYMVASVTPGAASATITTGAGADFYRASVARVDPQQGLIDCSLEVALAQKGYRENLVASYDRKTKF